MPEGLDQAEVDASCDAFGPDVDDLVDEAIETGDIEDPGELERLASLLAAGLRDAGPPAELGEALASLLENRGDEAAAALLAVIALLVPSFGERSSASLAALARTGVTPAIPPGTGEATLRGWRGRGTRACPVRLSIDAYLHWCDERDLDPDDSRAAYAADQMRAVDGLAWPPGRNDACWCESGRKYKRCCGMVTETVLHPLDANAGG